MFETITEHTSTRNGTCSQSLALSVSANLSEENSVSSPQSVNVIPYRRYLLSLSVSI